ncbi:MAG: GNAT family N-acetyltransferase [Chloroflexota bacterium]
MITEITGNKIRLREKRLSDAHNDYSWHADPELARLDGSLPTALTFERYVTRYTREMRFFTTTSRKVFAIENMDGLHIGNCAYYNIDRFSGETEIGIMIGDRDYWDSGYGTDALTTLINHIFRETIFKRLYLKTLESNKRAQACFKKCGFKPYMSMISNKDNFLYMEIYRKSWGKRQAES